MIRLTGSISSIRRIRSFASVGNSGGIVKRPILTLARRARMSSSSNGSRPVRRANRMIPHDQMSDEDP